MLWERNRELQRLDEALRACRDGRGATVLVSGDAGLGKTSLLRAFAAQVAEQATILSGTCDDLHTARILGPFRDMFEGPPFRQSGNPDRERYIGLLRIALSQQDKPAVIMVDDAHWADDASLDIIRYLGRRMDSLPGLLVITYRPGQVADEHPLRRVLGSLATSSTIRLDLHPLTDETVARLAEQAGRDPGAVIEAVGGNPFFLTEVLALDGTQVPPTVRDAVLAHVAALPESSRRALEALSVIPAGADHCLLDSVLEAPSTQPLRHAEEAGIAILSGDRIRYRHELARRAVEESLPGSVRSELNRRVLQWLAGRAAPASRLVHHAAAAGDLAAVARLAGVAAEEATAARAHSETAAYGRLALEHGDRLDPRTVARLHGLAAHALYALSRFGQAAEHAGQSVAAWERLDEAPLDLGEVLLVSARMHMMYGLPDPARAEIARALDLLRPLGPSGALAHAYAMMGNLEAIEANCAPAADWCREALAMAGTLDLPDVAAHARVYLGLARVGLGDLAGLDDLRTAIDLAARIDHGDLQCRAASNLVTALIWLGRHLEAGPYLDVAEAVAREHGLDYILFHVLAGRSHVDLYQGRWDAAERRLREQLATDRDPAAMMVLPLALLGRILARRGDPQAADLIGRAWTLATECRQGYRLAVAGAAVVEHAWLAGDRQRLLAVSDVLEPIARRANLVYLRGEIVRYRSRVGAAVAAFDGCPDGFAAGIAGDAASAAAAWRRAGNPYEQALEEVACADPQVAVRGVRSLDRLGATATANRCRRDLLRRGITGVPRGPRMRTRTHPAGLTGRQQDILALLGEGLTTQRIAERLFLSPRTVDHHVADILGLLGVTSRRDAVAAARRAGWLPHTMAG